MKVSAQYAEQHFADILHTALRGEDVEIATPEQTYVRLTLVQTKPFQRTTPRILGEGIGEMAVPSWDEWKAIDQDLEREINQHPLIPGAL
jgi:antitoxin (DNA-binding transcriptional repressor) of toxin-antitoxin stability system